jgi:CYTH domain-containing protein
MKGIGTGRVSPVVSVEYARERLARRFLLRELPPGLALQDEHLQITDNYLTATRLRLRKTRVPRTNTWTLELTQTFAPDPTDLSRTLSTSIYLSQYEYEALSVFEGNELRKNRYPYLHEGRAYVVDVFLGDLRGLILAGTEFASVEELRRSATPAFAVLDVTVDALFRGERLTRLTAAEIRAELAGRCAEGAEAPRAGA